MSNSIVPTQPFAFEGHDVRVLDIDGEPWFVASDVAKILGYESSYYLTRGLDEDEKGAHIVGTPGGDQEMTIISESGLYSAILRSRVEAAKAFKKWVTGTVLPQIRKTGSYGQAPQLSESEIVHQALQITARQVEELKAENAILKPESEAWRGLSRAIGDFVIADAAKIVARVGCKTGPGRLHKQIEHEWKWIFRRGEKKKRVVYQGVIDKGWMVARITSGYIDQITGERKNGTPEPRITVEGVGEIARRLGGDPEAAMAAAREEIRNQEAEATA